MPLGGLRCCRGTGIATTGECMEAAKCGECDYPLPLFHYLERKQGSRKNAGLSVTTVLNCPRKAQLEAEFPYYVTPATMGSPEAGNTGVRTVPTSTSSVGGGNGKASFPEVSPSPNLRAGSFIS